MAKPRLHLTIPVKPATRYQLLVKRGQRLLARQEAARMRAIATLDLRQSRKRGWR